LATRLARLVEHIEYMANIVFWLSIKNYDADGAVKLEKTRVHYVLDESGQARGQLVVGLRDAL